MRRGHPGVGGWRGENPRHFRPRGGQPPHFRPLMQYGPQEPSRFQSPGPRFRGPRPYSHSINSGDGPSDQERPYRGPGRTNSQPRSLVGGGHHDNRDRNILPMNRTRLHDHHSGPFNNSKVFYDANSYNTNNMGDVDHRACDVDHRQHDVDQRPHDVDLRSLNKFGPHSPWVNPPFERRQFTGPHKNLKQGMGDALLSLPDHTGHRPPSSDHYSGTSGPNNNNNPYSRSVDDTVDIVRKRLLNRDSQDNTNPPLDEREVDTDYRQATNEPYPNATPEQPVKKRIQRQRQERINCDNMKTKIVHQLFKMDKTKIHKLMDNPNSSSKFEYAISSLITESQNSFNRHLRSVAEKSLTTNNTSSDFIHNDNNTIYEDTFMRQMQGVLDPQDTILLEDIKPLVLAELSKVLCLEDIDRCESVENRFQGNDAYYNEPPESSLHYGDANLDTEVITGDLYENSNYEEHEKEDSKYKFSQRLSFQELSPPHLYERRPAKSVTQSEDRSRSLSNDSWHQRQSVDSNSMQTKVKSNVEIKENIDDPRPLFDGNCDDLSEDEDPFADLDNQYHVAVDHNFIEQEDAEIVSPVPDKTDYTSLNSKAVIVKTEITLPISPSISPSYDIDKGKDTQLQNFAQSPIKLLKNHTDKANTMKIKEEIQENVAVIKDPIVPKSNTDTLKDRIDPKTDSDQIKQIESGKHNSRKRSIDTRPSHRKEKRKKSSHSECQDEATSIFNIFFDKKSPEKVRTKETTDKKYSDKYVKRKESSSKDRHRKTSDTNTSHSITSPNTSSSVGDQTPKSDKSKLKTIDIFSEGTKPKKVSIHQAHRNTSTPLAVKNPDENKIKPIIPVVTTFARKLTKRHTGSQTTHKKLRHRECQTLSVKNNNCYTQTDPIKFDKDKPISNNPLERMKEIDMEIQMLLQEKFKIYNSMESKSKTNMSNTNSMGTLGMAVLNVPLEAEENIDENEDLLADSIAEDFANLPVEELEDIAMQTIINKKSEKVNRRKQMHVARKNSESPSTRKKQPKNDTPNISLLEQIISNDRPLEEIISLDDLERTPKRGKKKTSLKAQKKKSKKVKPKPSMLDIESMILKDCSVVLERIDVTEYIKNRSSCLKIKINLKSLQKQETDKVSTTSEATERSLSPVSESNLDDAEKQSPQELELENTSLEQPNIVVEEPNDIQIDMMEVCEDIVIGDEVKTVADADERVPVMEEIILDNSQSCTEIYAPEIVEGECKMFDYSTDDSLKRDTVTITANTEAVLALECIDNTFVAACLDGNVYHYSTDGVLLNTIRSSNLAVTCLTIVKEKYGTTVYTGSLDSRIRYYDLENGMEKGPECNVLSPIQAMDRAWDTIFVGTRTGFVLQFECKNNMLIPVSTVKFAEQSILALRAMKEGPRKVLLVAARSENVTIKDAQTGLLLRTLEGPRMTVYSLLFEDGKVYCGTSSHQIHVFDYTSGARVHAHEGGKGVVCMRATGGLLFAGCYDGCIYIYREGETPPLAQLRGPTPMLLSLAINGTKIIAGYKDKSFYIWKIPLPVLQEMIL